MQKEEKGNRRMISGKSHIQYLILFSAQQSRRARIRSMVRINGCRASPVEPELRNQEYENSDLLKKENCGRAKLQKMTIVEESKWRRYVAKTHDYSEIGFLVCHKASNNLISYGNGPSCTQTGKVFKDRYVWKDVHNERMVAPSAGREVGAWIVIKVGIAEWQRTLSSSKNIQNINNEGNQDA